MRLIFAGTPAFALPSLEIVHTAGHELVAVYTQPDRPAGRGRKLTPSPVKEYALAHGLPVYQPARLRGEEETLRAMRADAMIVAAYGLLLPPAVLAVPRYGCINVHASLLPRWRGAAPVARAIEAGDTETGATIMQMEEGLDTGPILLEAPMAILDTDTAASLERRLADLGAQTLRTALERLRARDLTPYPQNDARACYAPKLQKAEAPIDWSLPALALHRKVRALNPWPVASTTWRGLTLRIWGVGALSPGSERAGTPPGTVVDVRTDGVIVQTGAGLLTLTELQAPGARVLPVGEFINGTAIRPGDRLGI